MDLSVYLSHGDVLRSPAETRLALTNEGPEEEEARVNPDMGALTIICVKSRRRQIEMTTLLHLQEDE